MQQTYLGFEYQLILSALAKGPLTLAQIVEEAGGLYPSELAGRLQELILAGKVLKVEGNGSYLLVSSGDLVGYNFTSTNQLTSELPTVRQLKDHNTVRNITLPLPHPLDYDWRFMKETTKKLSRLITKKSSKGSESVLLMGTPSIFAELANQDSHMGVTLLDWSKELVRYLTAYNLPSNYQVIKHNLLSGKAWSTGQIIQHIVCDPPWYPEYYQAFLAQAALVSCLGTNLYLSLLTINTRPEAVLDRWIIFETANRLGFHLTKLEKETLLYQTPVFETSSLECSDIKIAGQWRRSDLAVFTKVENVDTSLAEQLLQEVAFSNPESQGWAELLVGSNKIKLHGPFNDYAEQPAIIPLEKANTLPTVSRRYTGRKAVDLWLWDNRVYKIKGKAAFLTALNTLANVSSEVTITPKLVSTQAVNQALELLLPIITYKDKTD